MITALSLNVLYNTFLHNVNTALSLNVMYSRVKFQRFVGPYFQCCSRILRIIRVHYYTDILRRSDPSHYIRGRNTTSTILRCHFLDLAVFTFIVPAWFLKIQCAPAPFGVDHVLLLVLQLCDGLMLGDTAIK